MEELTRRLYHTAPGRLDWRTEALLPPGPGEVVVRTSLSAISGGTEGLFFRGAVSEGTALDPNLHSLGGTVRYPFRYGYCLCGRVEGLGPGVDQDWLGRRVFAFEPHCSSFVTPVSALQPIPEEVPDLRAVLYPLAETAATLVLDASPRWNDRTTVFGLGPLGALTAGLLKDFPLGCLDLKDTVPARLKRVAEWTGIPAVEGEGDYDLAFDLGGTPHSLAAAVKSLGFGGRLVLGSWQGQDLQIPGAGTEFHRKRLEIVTSQVSTIAPALSARWTINRRSQAVWNKLKSWPVEELVSDVVPHEQAQQALERLQREKHSVFQVVLTYE